MYSSHHSATALNLREELWEAVGFTEDVCDRHGHIPELHGEACKVKWWWRLTERPERDVFVAVQVQACEPRGPASRRTRSRSPAAVCGELRVVSSVPTCC